MATIGVLGAGWLGYDLALRCSKNHSVFITNRNLKQVSSNLQTFEFEFGQTLPHFIEKLDYLFICSTISKEKLDFLKQFVDALRIKLKPNCCVVFTSTIGVYLPSKGKQNETSVCLNEHHPSLLFERLLQKKMKYCIILRLGGLIGKDRHPVYQLVQKNEVTDGDALINLIHKADIRSFFDCIIKQQIPTGIYNLVYPYHPTKKAYYSKWAIKLGLKQPVFLDGNSSGKWIDSTRSEAISGFSYQHKID